MLRTKNECALQTIIADDVTWVALPDIVAAVRNYPITDVLQILQDLNQVVISSAGTGTYAQRALLPDAYMPLYFSRISNQYLQSLSLYDSEHKSNPILPITLDLIYSTFYCQAYYKAGVSETAEQIHLDMDLNQISRQIYPNVGKKSVYASRKNWVTAFSRAISKINKALPFSSQITSCKEGVISVLIDAETRDMLLKASKDEVTVVSKVPVPFFQFHSGYSKLPSDTYTAPRLLLSSLVEKLQKQDPEEPQAEKTFVISLPEFLKLMGYDSYEAWFKVIHPSRTSITLQNFQVFLTELFKYTGLFTVQLLYATQGREIQVRVTPEINLWDLL